MVEVLLGDHPSSISTNSFHHIFGIKTGATIGISTTRTVTRKGSTSIQSQANVVATWDGHECGGNSLICDVGDNEATLIMRKRRIV